MISMILSCFCTFLDPFRGRKCLKMNLQSSFSALIWAKIFHKRSKISLAPPQGPPGTPTAAQRPPGIDLGAFWASFCGLLGCIFEPPQRLHSGSDVTLLPRLPSLLLSTSSFLILRPSPSFLPFLAPQETKSPRNQERKQPRHYASAKALKHIPKTDQTLLINPEPLSNIRTN